MYLKNLKLKNFKLFKEEQFVFSKINIIKGTNLSDCDLSSNGSGKSTILEGIIFALFGEGSGKNLRDLISFDTSSTEVTLELDNLKIIRKVPTDLNIFNETGELQFNTITLKQNKINELFNNYEFFKKYRLLNKQSINLLDLGITSLRKELMTFTNEEFAKIRQSLLNDKLIRETKNINKRLYKYYLSERRLEILEKGISKRLEIVTQVSEEVDKQYQTYNTLLSDIQAKEKEVYYKQGEIKKAKEGICPILKTKCEKISKSVNQTDTRNNLEVSKEIEQLACDVGQLKEQLAVEKDALNYYRNQKVIAENKEKRTNQFMMKLKEAFKFKEYSYTAKDVELYNYSIKVLDDFSGWYIQNWLNNLTLIINDLLSKVNLSVAFSADKEFITLTNEGQSMKYEALSGGQQVFLNAIFKLAILLNNNISDGIIIMDEGLSSLDERNFLKLITICKTLPFQFFIIYHGTELEIEEVNYIKIVRENNQSRRDI